ncbi:unnamed protein product [Miscanthus lutarioriparius]|uniref:Disease resistance protein RPM1 n=1 Tax=Miscanthus lutarioriparius TaxID=422564 RepID=A0A811QFG4_9POAL|nr:unnamed protein product [Miscanthus lutarioriparius]
MAEAVVGALIGKLGAALAKEAATYGAALLNTSALKDLFGEIRRAERELESMKAYLRESEKFMDTDETMGIFIKTIRELSFRIEDVVDEFMYKLEGNKHGGFAARIKKKIKQVKVWRRLSLQLRDINIELEDTVKRRDRYVIPNTGTGNAHHFAREDTNQASCFAREEELVGIEDDGAKLKGWLVDDLKQRNTKITTVWGMGGVGKTTLVDHVYKSVKLDFDASAWVTVSKSYKVEDLLKKIATEFRVPVNSSIMDMRRLVDAIRRHLEGKRFILVLDDVWEKEVWINNIMPVFPANCTRRFVLTSRLSEVASLASSNCAMKLEPLQDHHSYMLFCKLAFWDNDDKRCPPELSDLVTKFLQKCEGLPIAIACLGRLLSCKPPTYTEWKILFDELELQSVRNTIPGVETILKVSLEDLQYDLKNCFLHCALFPEDYELKRRRLIRHWITSGFIKKKENKTLEQVAEGYLNDLVNRSLLQVVMNNEFGRVKCCRMHDVIRHIAIEKAEKECFGKVYEGNETFLVHRTRRLSIQSTNIELLNLSGATHLRQIHVFTRFVDIDRLRPILSSSVLLSTLDLQGTEIKVLPNEIFSLFNLRFLGLRNTKIEVLPEAIGRLANLEVLDTWFTCLLSLPNDVAKLVKLRYLYATVKVTEGSFSRNRGVKMPRGIKNLTGLHALQNVKATSETLCDVAALTELQTFSVDDVTSEHSLILRNALLKMRNLVSLSITSMSDTNEVLPLEELCLPESLCKLGLTGKLKKKRMPHILSSWCLTYISNVFTVSVIASQNKNTKKSRKPNTAFRNSDDKRCPSELQDLAVKFLQKCEGLPIAIACIGRLLSVKQPTYSEWDSVYMELELQSNNNVIQGVDSILKVSLEDLPHELKNCFLHCAIFPEDYKLGRRRLIRHWITSGFIKEKENKTLEQVAEGYLNDLVNRSLLQVVMKNEFGRLRCCRMHDIIRHFALDKAAKECFCTVYEGHGTFSVHETRRLSINSTNVVPLNQSGVMQLRAIYVFTSSVDIDLLRPILASSTLLSTLDLQGTKIKMLPNEVFSLFNLRFLGLRCTGIETLPEAVGRLQNLEVLDAFDTGLLSLPKDVGKLKKLRYLYATVSVNEGSFWRQRGLKVPRGIIKNLTGLHALQKVKASSETLRDVAALTDLRTFAVDDVTSEHSLVLRSALQNMSSLVHLSIGMSNENEALPLEQLSLPETLSKLVLAGQLEKKRMPELLSSWLHLNYLIRLSLAFSKLDENSFPNLMVLRNLCSLQLYRAYDGKTLCFSVQSFPRLRELYIRGAPQLSQVEIEEGALGSLVELRFAGCPELKRLPRGIEYLTTLDELYLEDVDDELIKIIRQEGEANECKEELMKVAAAFVGLLWTFGGSVQRLVDIRPSAREVLNSVWVQIA